MHKTGTPKSSRAIALRPRIYFNGKFYAGAMNGVRRVADRLLRQIDELAASNPEMQDWDMRILIPLRHESSPDFRYIRKVPQRIGHSQFWEQCVLPFAASDGILVSLANLAPFLHPAKVTMVHDAQFRISPESYTLKLRYGFRLLIWAGARTSHTVLTVSDYARDSLEMFGIAPRERIAVVRNGGEHILEAEPVPWILDHLELRGQRFCLLFGSTSIYKNNQVVFDAFRSRRLSGMKLVVAGSTRDRLRDHGIVAPEGTIFAGPVSDGELRALYENALCLLFPSRTEGFGLPPLEAMICGCPVVSAPSGAMPEVCRDAALYADHSDPAAWVAQIVALARSPVLRNFKIEAGQARATAFGWRRAGTELVAEIAAVMASGKNARTDSPRALSPDMAGIRTPLHESGPNI